jgi:hypothetical protein
VIGSASRPLSDFGDNDDLDLDGIMLLIKMCAKIKREKILEYNQRKPPNFV